MLDALPHILAPLLAVILVTFVIYRLRFFSGDVGGRYPMAFGGALVLLAAVWQSLKAIDSYNDWFILSAYPAINFVQFLALAGGLVLMTIGLALYADYWQSRRDDIDEREGKLIIFDNLLRESRQPYQLVRFLDISLREILFQYPECSGAVFLFNRSRRQFVLSSAAGLNKIETAALEHHPFGRNIMSESLELGEPMIAGQFEMIDRDGQPRTSRFNSSLVLPLVSGREKMGVILLLSEQRDRFGKTAVRLLVPVAEWLGERINSARLSRDLNSAREEAELSQDALKSFTGDMHSLLDILQTDVSADAVCTEIQGTAGSESVHLIGLRNGSLTIFGGSEPLAEFSEAYRTALLDAIEKNKPLIINQEGSGDSGRPEVVFSTLVAPIDTGSEPLAMILRRSGGPFRVNDRKLKEVELLAGFGHLAVRQQEQRQRDVGRRRGFDAILNLLRLDEGPLSIHDNPGYFAEQLAVGLPRSTALLTLTEQDGGRYTIVDTLPAGLPIVNSVTFSYDDEPLAAVIDSGMPSYLVGEANISRWLGQFTDAARGQIESARAAVGAVGMAALIPVRVLDRVPLVVVAMIPATEDAYRQERERLITLASGLFSFRLTMQAQMREQTQADSDEAVSGLTGEQTNEINNQLSAIIGGAELVSRDDTLAADFRNQLHEIISAAERAADVLKQHAAQTPSTGDRTIDQPRRRSFNEAIKDVLDDNRIAGDLYMAGGRPREIGFSLNAPDDLDFASEEIQELVNGVIDRFGAQIADDDLMSVATYRKGDHVYLDISRHRRNFPPVESVAGFGSYRPASDVLTQRPSDVFLKVIADRPVEYAVDRESAYPAYLSFKFPVKQAPQPPQRPDDMTGRQVRMLAIDDHAVILDLVSAMGQSLGYQVDTAEGGREGLRLAEQNAYDIVLTDLAMPDISGLDVARDIHARYPDLPIILVTGWEANIDRSELEAAGIRDVLYKPFRIEQLTELVQSFTAPGHK